MLYCRLVDIFPSTLSSSNKEIMSESSPADFIELDDHWRSITRRDHNARGVGKWILGSADPHRLYQILREEMLSGVLLEVISMKTKKERAKGEGGGVYLSLYRYRKAAACG